MTFVLSLSESFVKALMMSILIDSSGSFLKASKIGSMTSLEPVFLKKVTAIARSSLLLSFKAPLFSFSWVSLVQALSCFNLLTACLRSFVSGS